jgi:biotin carboxyl carrier protein
MKYNVRIGERSYSVEIESLHTRPILAIVDGERFEVWPETGEQAVPAMPAGSEPVKVAGSPRVAGYPPPVTSSIPSGTALNVKQVRAPIPGVIVDIKVKPDDQVEFGQPLFTIEAMKMRNSIRAARSGVVGEIFVISGQTVNHNDKLMEYAE